MATRKIHFYYIGAGASGANLASIDILRNGTLRGVHWHVEYSAATLVDTVTLELSRTSTAAAVTHNSQGCISVVTLCNLGTTSGVNGCLNYADVPMAEPVRAGERLYLNCSIKAGASNYRIVCQLTVED